jgi:YspA, cpYpsA-related SLOG family
MRVLVCGGRDFHDAGLMNSVLDRLHTEKFFTVLIHGNARGADRIADAWASCRGIPREPYEVPQAGRVGRTRQESWPTAQSADARRRQARSGPGVSGERNYEEETQLKAVRHVGIQGCGANGCQCQAQTRASEESRTESERAESEAVCRPSSRCC